jgi:hypothetical protein
MIGKNPLWIAKRHGHTISGSEPTEVRSSYSFGQLETLRRTPAGEVMLRYLRKPYEELASWDHVHQSSLNSLISLTELHPGGMPPPAIPHSIAAFDRLDIY